MVQCRSDGITPRSVSLSLEQGDLSMVDLGPASHLTSSSHDAVEMNWVELITPPLDIGQRGDIGEQAESSSGSTRRQWSQPLRNFNSLESVSTWHIASHG